MKKIEQVIKSNLSKKKWTNSANLVASILYELDIHLSPVELRDHIKQLRLMGTPIIASAHLGYKLAKDKAELEEYYISRIRELNSEREVLKAMMKGVR